MEYAQKPQAPRDISLLMTTEADNDQTKWTGIEKEHQQLYTYYNRYQKVKFIG